MHVVYTKVYGVLVARVCDESMSSILTLLILNTRRPHTHTHPYLSCPHIYQGETDTYGTVVSSRLAAPHQS